MKVLNKIFLALFLFVASISHSFATDFLPMAWTRIGGGTITTTDADNLAKGDIIIVARKLYDDVGGGDSWTYIKNQNANAKIYVYISPTTHDNQDAFSLCSSLSTMQRWDNPRGHSMGDLNNDNPGLFATYGGERINYGSDSTRWMFDYSDADFIAYFSEAALTDLEGTACAADGIYVDNTVTWNCNGFADCPSEFGPTHADWLSVLENFVNEVQKDFEGNSPPVLGAFNRAGLFEGADNATSWATLDGMSNPPDVIVEEGTFATRSGENSDVQFYSATAWKRIVDAMVTVSNSKIVMLSAADIIEGGSGLDHTGDTVTYWEVLWFAMGSFHIAKNTTDNNCYFAWHGNSYQNTPWHDEYDASNDANGNLKFGEPVGTYTTITAGSATVYRREFQYGYVYVNPDLNNDGTGITLPETVKEITHSNVNDALSSIEEISGTITVPEKRARFFRKLTTPKKYDIQGMNLAHWRGPTQ